MLALIGSLGRQLRRGHELGGAATAAVAPADRILVCGMGGSGLAGDVAKAVAGDAALFRVEVWKDYAPPATIRDGTLVVAVSFSGETEETIDCYSAARAMGCPIVAVSSGGRLAELARRDGVAHVDVPDDVPLPRAAVGYQAGALLACVEAAMGGRVAVREPIAAAAALLEDLAARWGRGTGPGNEPRAVGGWLAGRVPIVWGSAPAVTALRWKTQLNENAKVPAFVATLPELDHNDIEGWSPSSGNGFRVVVLRHGFEHPRIARRLEATIDQLAGSGLEFREVRAVGESRVEQLFSLIAFGDYASTYLADALGVDPLVTPALSSLKERLRS